MSFSYTSPNVGASVEWQTPPEILAALAPFDDDPCLPGRTDGLTRPWTGLVWLNPPYGRNMWPWLDRLADHGNGIAITFARTETRGFRRVWERATALLFLSGRPHFYMAGKRAKGNSGAPVVLIAYGDMAKSRLELCGLPGALVTGWKVV